MLYVCCSAGELTAKQCGLLWCFHSLFLPGIHISPKQIKVN